MKLDYSSAIVVAVVIFMHLFVFVSCVLINDKGQC